MEAEQALREEAHWAARTAINLDAKSEPDVMLRLSSYKPRSGGDYICPKCAIRSGRMSPMRAVPGTNQYDMLRCNSDACGASVIIPL